MNNVDSKHINVDYNRYVLICSILENITVVYLKRIFILARIC